MIRARLALVVRFVRSEKCPRAKPDGTGKYFAQRLTQFIIERSHDARICKRSAQKIQRISVNQSAFPALGSQAFLSLKKPKVGVESRR
ncbi:MAG: hypothetical protein HS116_11750 [Planctomycetes bacterium]|nr:hypothetical protein [Planctomycetota bacterium]